MSEKSEEQKRIDSEVEAIAMGGGANSVYEIPLPRSRQLTDTRIEVGVDDARSLEAISISFGLGTKKHVKIELIEE